MNQYNISFRVLDDKTKFQVPVIYNCIYRFDKRKIVKQRGKRYYGVPASMLQTPVFFPWGHHKPISKMVDGSAIEFQLDKEEKIVRK